MNNLRYILIFLLVLSIIAVDIHFSSSYQEYSMYNSNWNGTSIFINDALGSGAGLVRDYEELSGIKNSTLIIIEPDGNFSPDELRTIRDYRSKGNKIFISDETGSSGILLKLLNTGLSIEKANLSGLDFKYRNFRFLICYTSGNDSLLSGVKSIALNKPSVASGGETLVSSSFLSWIDENGNGRADETESLGKRSVLVKSGEVYLLSDSGIFQNSLYGDKNMNDNPQLMENLLESSEKVYIEARHSGVASGEGLLVILNAVRQSEMIKAITIIIIVSLLLLFYRGKNGRT
jgi:hypothetical protein